MRCLRQGSRYNIQKALQHCIRTVDIMGIDIVHKYLTTLFFADDQKTIK